MKGRIKLNRKRNKVVVLRDRHLQYNKGGGPKNSWSINLTDQDQSKSVHPGWVLELMDIPEPEYNQQKQKQSYELLFPSALCLMSCSDLNRHLCDVRYGCASLTNLTGTRALTGPGLEPATPLRGFKFKNQTCPRSGPHSHTKRQLHFVRALLPFF